MGAWINNESAIVSFLKRRRTLAGRMFQVGGRRALIIPRRYALTHLILSAIKAVPAASLTLDIFLRLADLAGQRAHAFGRLWMPELKLNFCKQTQAHDKRATTLSNVYRRTLARPGTTLFYALLNLTYIARNARGNSSRDALTRHV